jgi:hypothetical protein
MLAQTATPSRYWSPADLQWLREHIGRRGWSLELAARQLGRTPAAVKLQLKRQRVRRPVTGPTAHTLTLRDVCAELGLGEHWRPVRRWIAERKLRAERVPMSGDPSRRAWAIYPAELVEFLQRHPECYDYDRLPRSSPYRQYARRHDPTAGYLSTKQAARRRAMSCV